MDKTTMLGLVSAAFAWWRGENNQHEKHEYVCDALLITAGYGPEYRAAQAEVLNYLGEFSSCHAKAGVTGKDMSECKEEPAVLAEREKLWNHLLIWAREYDAQHST